MPKFCHGCRLFLSLSKSLNRIPSRFRIQRLKLKVELGMSFCTAYNERLLPDFILLLGTLRSDV